MSRSPEHRIWLGIKTRCLNPRHKSFKAYGAKGILICPLWQTSFLAFYREIGPRPSLTHSVDRIDNLRGYEPGNVRWATPFQQAQNSSLARPIMYQGRTMTAAEWARELGIGYQTIIARLNRHLAPEQVLSTKLLYPPAQRLEHGGLSLTILEWAQRIGVSKSILKKRLAAGIPLHRALSNPMPPRAA